MSDEAREDQRTAMMSCALVFAAEVAFAAIDARALGPVAAWLDVGHAALAALGVALLARVRAPDSRLAAAVFSVAALYFLPQTWLSEIIGVQRGAVRDPLVPHQFLLLGVAVLVPGRRWLGMTLLAVTTASAAGLWLLLTGGHSLGGEPWMTLAFAGVAVTLAWMRFDRREAFQALAQSEAEAAALARMARLFMAIRDRTNTPLQTLELGLALLERPDADVRRVMASMGRALGRLRELSAMLEVPGEWKRDARESDVTADLRRDLEQARRAMGGGAEHAP